MRRPVILIDLLFTIRALNKSLLARLPVLLGRLKVVEAITTGQRALDLFLQTVKDVTLVVCESHGLALTRAVNLGADDLELASDIHHLFHEAPRCNLSLAIGTTVVLAHLSAPVLKALATSDTRLAVRTQLRLVSKAHTNGAHQLEWNFTVFLGGAVDV